MRKPQSFISLVAAGTSFLQGVVIFLLGALRLGWLVEFIPAPAVGGFVTGSAIQIIASQLPPLLGIKSEGDSSFEIFWNTLRNIRKARVDSALGISGLASLYLLRWVCQVLTKKYPQHGLSSLSLLYPPHLLTGFVLQPTPSSSSP
jgi:sodium-independent sulfate anion transporter 11